MVVIPGGEVAGGDKLVILEGKTAGLLTGGEKAEGAELLP